MAHCPPDLLDDLEDVLAEVRAWAGVVEKTPGVLYLRGQPFLHFHLVAGGRRRGDIICSFQMHCLASVEIGPRRSTRG